MILVRRPEVTMRQFFDGVITAAISALVTWPSLANGQDIINMETTFLYEEYVRSVVERFEDSHNATVNLTVNFGGDEFEGLCSATIDILLTDRDMPSERRSSCGQMIGSNVIAVRLGSDVPIASLDLSNGTWTEDAAKGNLTDLTYFLAFRDETLSNQAQLADLLTELPTNWSDISGSLPAVPPAVVWPDSIGNGGGFHSAVMEQGCRQAGVFDVLSDAGFGQYEIASECRGTTLEVHSAGVPDADLWKRGPGDALVLAPFSYYLRRQAQGGSGDEFEPTFLNMSGVEPSVANLENGSLPLSWSVNLFFSLLASETRQDVRDLIGMFVESSQSGPEGPPFVPNSGLVGLDFSGALPEPTPCPEQGECPTPIGLISLGQ
jgi:ABC-type phosphate transport system substrate-binding protein